ncbi:unnamed protein product [Rotaria sp. Silwood2]|nr:unnamed protein product [Rotaria sp. Silwood2]CAF3429544.1 unnamed protein product [Rotaria sp. Silwood2]CAF4206276.1 unnamed protein product [Rotaria sp. Silwood2]
MRIYILLIAALQPHLNMNQNNIHLLDLPNEILFLILKKLDNIDVLYSLHGINNQRLDIIAHEQIFSNVLNFVSISQPTDEISLISGSILNRFCNDILPKIHEKVKSLTLDSVSMECILRAGNYPNLTELKLFNFNKIIISRYFISKIFMCTDPLED